MRLGRRRRRHRHPHPPEAASKSAHGPDHFLISPPEFILPDRKNGLASVESLHHHPHRLFAHFLTSHGTLQNYSDLESANRSRNIYISLLPVSRALILLYFHILAKTRTAISGKSKHG